MEDKQPKDRPGRNFYFTKEATYIEKQEITVQSGAKFYNGPAPKSEEQEAEGEPKTKSEPRGTLSPAEAFARSITNLINDKIICRKQDFAIIFKLDLEMCLLGSVSYEDFCKRVNELVDIPDTLCPNVNSIKSLYLGNKEYPNWDYDEKDATNTSHIKAVANGYIREMNKYGYAHNILLKE